MNTKLTFVSECKERKDNHIVWVCECSCGNIGKYLATRVRHGKVLSCKKCSYETIAKKIKIHGMRNTKEYAAWVSAKDRCFNVNSKDYYRYGGAGITMSDNFANSFECFFNEIGKRPHGHSLDRIDNTRGYEKGNIRWASRSEQQINKSSSYRWFIKGVEFESCYSAAAHFAVKPQTIIKWTDGYFDNRRNRFTPPKPGCTRVKRYG